MRGPAQVEVSPLPFLGPKSFFIADSQWRGCVDNCAGVCVRRACMFAVGPSQGFTLTKSHYKRFGVVGTEWYLYPEKHRQEGKAIRANALGSARRTSVRGTPNPPLSCPKARLPAGFAPQRGLGAGAGGAGGL